MSYIWSTSYTWHAFAIAAISISHCTSIHWRTKSACPQSLNYGVPSGRNWRTESARPQSLIYGVPPGMFCQCSCRSRHFYEFEQFYIIALFCISTVYQRIYARPYLYNLLTSLLLADLLCPAAHLQSVSIWCMSNIWHIPGISAVYQHIYDTAGILQSIDIFDTY